MAFVGLGVAGGIGAYKAVEIARLLQKRGHRVQAVMTKNARRFVGPLTFEAITREPVITSQFTPGLNASVEHIALASTIDVLVVAPATADVIAQFAHGLAGDFLSSLFLATRAPVILAPSMNTNMWEHAAVQANLAVLRSRGVSFVEPGDGYLACGWIGRGRLAEPEDVVAAVEARLQTRTSLAGRRVLVTAGPTLEDIDPVRFIGNRSSGRMGFAIALEAQARGATVQLVVGPTSIDPPATGEVVRVRRAREMHAAVLARADGADVVVMAAAVADYAPALVAESKIEKGGPLRIDLERTPDILADLGARRAGGPRPVLVGFAAQTGVVEDVARRKLETKRVDLIVANDVTEPGAGFDVDTNRVTLVSGDGVERLPLMSKREVAGLVLDRVETRLAETAALAAPRA
ncbi:MAG TPA: bifunctional phosphopantothenoylcysteine decarboxylase/phosphopantothenate--cysteine ligase CoaBC [Vicinamibacterales bacterium]|jgi:phosphopantothenoylcysteine decarboxylase/phosphopantothenate--cysteine ligase|nr:bifunctional phosphopantothenoylcysteine decarboxylase/phosphopantothenate--cysteine ligase CoaBC [Vicinamibacterales bacterium]